MKSVLRKVKQIQDGTVKMSILVLGVALVGIWVISIYANYAVREGMQRTLSEQQFSTVSIVAAQVNDELQHRVNVLATLASQLSTQTQKGAAGIQAFLSEHPILKEDFNGGIFVTDTHGVAIADFPVVQGQIGPDYVGRESTCTPIEKGMTVIGKPNMGKTLKAPKFSIVAPIQSAQGEVIGCVVGTVNLGLPNFLDKLSNGSYGRAGGYLLIAPQYRLLVTASDKRRAMEVLPPIGTNPAMDRMLEDHDITQIFVNSKGVEVLTSGVTIPASGWRVVVAIPTNEAFESVIRLQQHVLLAAIIATLLGCAMTWWLLKSQRSAVLALYDPLTQLANRRLLVDRLHQAMANSQRSSTFFAVMVLDLDNFKPLNDKHGHLAGDELLIEVASRLKRSMRDIDTVARFGGDEFVVVLGDLGAEPGAATEQARAIADEIRATLAEPYRMLVRQNGLPGVVVEHLCTVSVGVTLGRGYKADPDEILKMADEAMYQAKEAGQNQVKIACA